MSPTSPANRKKTGKRGKVVASGNPSTEGGECKKTLNLALQGGGAHGAFTWGVLDRLLEDERLAIEGISGTSAGAMNAAVMADGLTRGGRAGARLGLEQFWTRVADLGRLNPLNGGPLDWLAKTWQIDPTLSYLAFDSLTRILSPYQFNPLNWHPLRDVLEQSIDFQSLSCCTAVKLFISATNVRSGKNRIFHCGELSADVLLASACLPFLFQAVEIEGEAYWDGGYMGNPAIYPLIYECDTKDIAIVQVNPISRSDIPKTAAEILDRVNEISFNSTLMREMRAIAFVTKLIDSKTLDDKLYKRMNLHLIESESEMRRFGVASKLDTNMDFLLKLRDLGRAAADSWLSINFDKIGKMSSIDIVERFL